MSDISVDIRALANLARLEVSDSELAQLEKEIPDILKFVDIVQKAPVSKELEASEVHNVMRDDDNAYESGSFTDVLLDAAPAREANRVVVKQVVSRKQK